MAISNSATAEQAPAGRAGSWQPLLSQGSIPISVSVYLSHFQSISGYTFYIWTNFLIKILERELMLQVRITIPQFWQFKFLQFL